MAKQTDLLDKKTVLRSLKSLPDRFNADDAIERTSSLRRSLQAWPTSRQAAPFPWRKRISAWPNG